jgi:3-deoxy-7-phosphoheptulonate synthase
MEPAEGEFDLGDQYIPARHALKRVGRAAKPQGTEVNVRGVRIGGIEVIVIAGPCAVESEEQLMATAKAVKSSGANILRGGAFKPRSSPYSFQGLKQEALRILSQVREETGLPLATEVLDIRQLDLICKYADMLQVGSRSMQNFPMLEEVGRSQKPVLLKRLTHLPVIVDPSHGTGHWWMVPQLAKAAIAESASPDHALIPAWNSARILPKSRTGWRRT